MRYIAIRQEQEENPKKDIDNSEDTMMEGEQASGKVIV